MELLKKQRNLKEKHNREISNLTNVSEDLRRKSLQRKKEMDELQDILKWRKSYNNTYKIPKGKKEKNKERLSTSTRPTLSGTLSTAQKEN